MAPVFIKNKKIDNFLIKKKIGEGGMSVIYKATDLDKKRDVALKFLKKRVTSAYIEDQIRFKREAEAISKLNHPNIIRLFGIGEYNKTPYLIEELLDGEILTDLLSKKQKFTINQSLTIIIQLAKVLNYVHIKGIIHRDIKPDNILIKYDKGKQVVKLIDFGISHIMELTQIKEDKNIIGTFGYMSPEATGMIIKPIDERSDLYSLGVIFYQLLTNTLPFKSTEINKLMHEQVAIKALRVKEINHNIPQILEDVINKLMHKEQDLRYQSAKGLLYDLEKIQKGEKKFIIGEKDQKIKLTYQTGIVGREKELSIIKDLINKASLNKGSICLIKGEPGIGKSRLIMEIKEYINNKLHRKGDLFLTGRSVSQENKTPYQAFKDSINEYIRNIEKLETKEKNKEIKRIKSLTGEFGEVLIKLNPNMKKILGKTPELVNIEQTRQYQRFLMIVSGFFYKIAKEGNICILFLDDLQWADEGSLRLLEELATGISKSNLLILGTYRSNEVDEKHSLNHIIKKQRKHLIEEIELSKFDHSQLNKMTAGILGEKEKYAHKLTEYVLKKSGGNPFFIITILRELVEQKALTWEKDYWVENWEKINKVQILSNIVDMVLLRIKELPQEIDKLLRICSIIGKEFDIKTLYGLLDEEKDLIVSQVDEAIKWQLLEESITKKGKILFIHDRIREAFYKEMKEDERKKIHMMTGEFIEKSYKDKKNETIFDLVYHFSEGGDNGRVLKYILTAARKMEENFVHDEAIKYYKQGIKLLEKKGEKGKEKWINAKEELADIYLTIGNNNEAIKIANTILVLKNFPIEKARIYRKIGTAYCKKGDWKNCESNLANALIQLGEKLPVKKTEVFFVLLKELIIHLAHNFFPIFFNHKSSNPVKNEDKEKILIYVPLNWMYILSDVNKFICNTLKMLNIAESKIGKSKELGRSLGIYAGLCMAIPLFKRARKFHAKAINIRKKLNNQWELAQALQFAGYNYQWEGDYQKSIEIFERSKEKFEKTGDIWELGMVLQGLGHNHSYKGNYENKANSYLNTFLKLSLKLKDNYGISDAYGWLSILDIEHGDFEEADKKIKKALKISRKEKVLYIVCCCLLCRAYLMVEQKKWKVAIKSLKEAKTIYDNNTFLKNYTINIFVLLAEAHLGYYKENELKLDDKKKKQKLKEIKYLSHKALKKTRNWPNHYGSALRITAIFYDTFNNKRKAKKFFLKSITQTKSIGRMFEFAKSSYEYGLFLQSINKKNQAKEQWQIAFTIFKDIDAAKYIEYCKTLPGIQSINEDKQSPQNRLSMERRMKTVLNTGRYLSSILILDDLLEKILDKTIEMTGAERGIFFLYPDESQILTPSEKNVQLKAKIIRNFEKSDSLDQFKINRKIIDRAIKEMKPFIIEDASLHAHKTETTESHYSRVKSILCAPVVTRDRLFGVIYLDNRMMTSLFKEEDLDVLEMICSQSGISIENAILYKSRQEQVRLKKEMEIAEKIQTALVPEPPNHEELEITALMRPAEEVGGDYYDIMFDHNNNLWFAIGDVCGHGVTPGLIMMMAQAFFSASLTQKKDITPKDAIISVNNLLYTNIKERLKENHFMTMTFLKYLGKGKFLYAGLHLDIIIYRKKTKTCELKTTNGLYLGIIPDIKKKTKDYKLALNKNDIMLLYTDGVIEARHNDNRDQFTVEKLQEILIENADKNINEIKEIIIKETLIWCGNKPVDDITMVLAKRK